MLSILCFIRVRTGHLRMIQKKQNTGSKIARLSAARLAAVQAVYQMRAGEQSARDIVSEYRTHHLGQPVEGQAMVAPDTELFAHIVGGVESRMEDLRGIIDASLVVQDSSKPTHCLDSTERLLGSILLCGSYELLAHHDIDAPLIIADYLDVTHAFYEGNEAKLVNAVLDRIRKAVRDE